MSWGFRLSPRSVSRSASEDGVAWHQVVASDEAGAEPRKGIHASGTEPGRRLDTKAPEGVRSMHRLCPSPGCCLLKAIGGFPRARGPFSGPANKAAPENGPLA